MSELVNEAVLNGGGYVEETDLREFMEEAATRGFETMICAFVEGMAIVTLYRYE